MEFGSKADLAKYFRDEASRIQYQADGIQDPYQRAILMTKVDCYNNAAYIIENSVIGKE